MFFFKKKLSLRDAWKADADTFGLSDETQQGLAFLIALDLCSNAPFDDEAELTKYIQRFSKKAPLPKDGEAGDFNDTKISALLSEFAFRTDPTFSPRPVYRGVIYAFERPKEDRLPSFDPNQISLRVCDELINSLCRQIGESIEGDVEQSYLAGFVFFSSYVQMDVEGTLRVSRLPNKVLPPHYKWFRHCLNFSPEAIAQGNSIQKILDCFLAGDSTLETPKLYQLTCHFSDQLHYLGKGIKNDQIWATDIPTFAFIAAKAQLGMDQDDPEEEWVIDARRILLDKGFEMPQVCLSHLDAINLVAKQVFEKWGFNITVPSKDLTPGEQWLRRCCIVFMCTVNAVLQPKWNKINF
jgi:hypothetical protein